MKKLLAILVVMTMTFSLIACGDKNDQVEEKGKPKEEEKIKGVPYDSGLMSILVPEGWGIVEVDTDDIKDAKRFFVCKGVDGIFDQSSQVNFYFNYAGTSGNSTLEKIKERYEEVTDIDAFKAGDFQCNGFTFMQGKSQGIMIVADNGSECFSISGYLIKDEQKVTIDDEEVQMILTSFNQSGTVADVEAEVKNAEINMMQDGIVGKFVLASRSVNGEKMNYAYLQNLSLGENYIIFTEDGEVKQIVDGKEDLTLLKHSKNTLTFGIYPHEFKVDGDILTFTYANSEFSNKFVYIREDSPNWEEIKAEAAAITEDPETIVVVEEVVEPKFEDVVPGFGSEEIVPVEKIVSGMEFYGEVSITLYEGKYPEFEGVHEAWGYIMNDEDGNPDYFEIYFNGPYETGEGVLSHYIKINEDTLSFVPVLDEEAWIYDIGIIEDEYKGYEPKISYGRLMGSYKYEVEDESFWLNYCFGEIKS